MQSLENRLPRIALLTPDFSSQLPSLLRISRIGDVGFVEVRTSLIHYVKITYLKIKTKHALGIKYEVKSNSR